MALMTIKNKRMEGAEVLLQKLDGQYSLYLRENDVRAGVRYLIRNFESFEQANTEYERLNSRTKIHQILVQEGDSLA